MSYFKKFVGIDYSMRSPGICIFDYDTRFPIEFKFENCKLHFFSDAKMHQGFKDSNITCHSLPLYTSDQSRFANLAEATVKIIRSSNLNTEYIVYLEGYSMGSRSGLLFNIAENTSILKDRLYFNSLDFQVVAPTTIKKFATGKGNSDKAKMYESFESLENGLNPNLKDRLLTKTIKSPLSDIVDSYYICRYAYKMNIEE